MTEKQNKSSVWTKVKFLLSVVLFIGPLVIVQFVPMSRSVETIFLWVCIGIGIVLFRFASKNVFPKISDESMQDFPVFPLAVRVLLAVIAFLIPVIAGQFLQFNYLFALLVAFVALGVLLCAIEPWLEKVARVKSEQRADLIRLLFLAFFFVSFGFFSGDLRA